jgi:hypothetical protein
MFSDATSTPLREPRATSGLQTGFDLVEVHPDASSCHLESFFWISISYRA